jgi:3-phenylpropionate/trans-cinnamate dioxygenase ferredoxin reductase subunit
MKSIAVVGSSLAGLSTASALRSNGFDGKLIMIGAERRMPYDRPPLSKEFLTGSPQADSLDLADAQEIEALDAEWHLGRVARKLSPERGGVFLADGTLVRADGVVAATGASPRMLPGCRSAAGVHTLRTITDAEALRADLRIGSPEVVVIGGSFIGAEVASSARSMGLSVTIVDASLVPLAPALGKEMGAICSELHSDNGVRLVAGTGVAGLSRSDGRVTGVELADGGWLPADVVVVGIGVRPNTDWLVGSGVGIDDGVLCDSGCVTENPSVVAVGDLARLRFPGEYRGVRHEHWTAATSQPEVAARNLLAGKTVANVAGVPYFWSDQYGVRIQFAGDTAGSDEVVIVEGSAEDRQFVAHYRSTGEVVGVLSFNQPRSFAKAKRSIGKPAFATA